MKIHVDGVDRDMTEQETIEYQSLFDTQNAAIIDETTDASNVLAKLGLTVDELKALLG